MTMYETEAYELQTLADYLVPAHCRCFNDTFLTAWIELILQTGASLEVGS